MVLLPVAGLPGAWGRFGCLQGAQCTRLSMVEGTRHSEWSAARLSADMSRAHVLWVPLTGRDLVRTWEHLRGGAGAVWVQGSHPAMSSTPTAIPCPWSLVTCAPPLTGCPLTDGGVAPSLRQPHVWWLTASSHGPHFTQR